jgi:hypothetical protein
VSERVNVQEEGKREEKKGKDSDLIPETATEWEAPAEMREILMSPRKESKRGEGWFPWSPNPNLPPSPAPQV